MLQKRDRLFLLELCKKAWTIYKAYKKQIKSSNGSTKNKHFSEIKKVKQLHSEIPKFKT